MTRTKLRNGIHSTPHQNRARIWGFCDKSNELSCILTSGYQS